MSPTLLEFRQMLVINGMAARTVNLGFVSLDIHDLELVFQAYEGPMLLIHGAHDQLVRLAMSESIAAMLPWNRLSIFTASGHSPFLEKPARFARELVEFVTASAVDL